LLVIDSKCREFRLFEDVKGIDRDFRCKMVLCNKRPLQTHKGASVHSLCMCNKMIAKGESDDKVVSILCARVNRTFVTTWILHCRCCRCSASIRANDAPSPTPYSDGACHRRTPTSRSGSYVISKANPNVPSRYQYHYMYLICKLPTFRRTRPCSCAICVSLAPTRKKVSMMAFLEKVSIDSMF
jgi:hypothetical protein